MTAQQHRRTARSARQTSDEDLFDTYRASREPWIRDELVRRHLWLAERCAHRYHNHGEPHDDLVQVGRLGLVKAVERYDPSCGPFVRYAIPTIIGELKHHFRDTTWSISVPRRAKELHTRVNAATEALRHQLGRAPTVDELADHAGIPRDHIIETLGAHGAYRPLSLDCHAHVGGAVDVSADQRADPDAAEARVMSRQLIARLDERERTIVYFTYFQGLTQQEIGDRLGIGQVQVSRLLAAALRRLRRHLHENAPAAA